MEVLNPFFNCWRSVPPTRPLPAALREVPAPSMRAHPPSSPPCRDRLNRLQLSGIGCLAIGLALCLLRATSHRPAIAFERGAFSFGALLFLADWVRNSPRCTSPQIDLPGQGSSSISPKDKIPAEECQDYISFLKKYGLEPLRSGLVEETDLQTLRDSFLDCLALGYYQGLRLSVDHCEAFHLLKCEERLPELRAALQREMADVQSLEALTRKYPLTELVALGLLDPNDTYVEKLSRDYFLKEPHWKRPDPPVIAPVAREAVDAARRRESLAYRAAVQAQKKAERVRAGQMKFAASVRDAALPKDNDEPVAPNKEELKAARDRCFKQVREKTWELQRSTARDRRLLCAFQVREGDSGAGTIASYHGFATMKEHLEYNEALENEIEKISVQRYEELIASANARFEEQSKRAEKAFSDAIELAKCQYYSEIAAIKRDFLQQMSN